MPSWMLMPTKPRVSTSIIHIQNTVPLSHGCLTIELHLSGKVISSKLKQSIWDAYTVPPYLSYLQSRNQWSLEVFNSINWDAYNQAISWFPSQWVQVTKLCNNLLPTAWWANWYDTLTIAHCLHCGELEDRDHMVRCAYPPRQKWPSNLLAHLRKAHDSTETNPYIIF
jgi:hypothetical protein